MSRGKAWLVSGARQRSVTVALGFMLLVSCSLRSVDELNSDDDASEGSAGNAQGGQRPVQSSGVGSETPRGGAGGANSIGGSSDDTKTRGQTPISNGLGNGAGSVSNVADGGTNAGAGAEGGISGGVSAGAGGVSCEPTTCKAEGKNCGTIADGCNANLECGKCASNQECKNNVCVTVCAPTSCEAESKTCGTISDGCGKTLSCGTCASTRNCVDNVCQGCNASISDFKQGKCRATARFGGALYRCISQARGVNGEVTGCGTTGVYCNNTPPDDVVWGKTAWQFVHSCD